MVGGAFCASAGEVPPMSNAMIARLPMVVILTSNRWRVLGERKRDRLALFSLDRPGGGKRRIVMFGSPDKVGC